jgi:hypothetical protein
MTLAKRLALERNQRRQKILSISNTECSTFTGWVLGLSLPIGGGVIAIGMSLCVEVKMCSEEDMVVEVERRSSLMSSVAASSAVGRLFGIREPMGTFRF